MDVLYDVLKFLHVMSFVFMSVPLFNLIVVNERGKFGPGIVYHADRYMENIIRGGAPRCFVFQSTVLVTGLLLLVLGDLGIAALWSSWVILTKMLLLFTLVGLLSYVHFGLQPKIEAGLADVKPGEPVPEGVAAQIKPYRVRRKTLASVCLFLVITIIILGLQVYAQFKPLLTVGLVALAALFAWRVNRTAVRFGWV